MEWFQMIDGREDHKQFMQTICNHLVMNYNQGSIIHCETVFALEPDEYGEISYRDANIALSRNIRYPFSFARTASKPYDSLAISWPMSGLTLKYNKEKDETIYKVCVNIGFTGISYMLKFHVVKSGKHSNNFSWKGREGTPDDIVYQEVKYDIRQALFETLFNMYPYEFVENAVRSYVDEDDTLRVYGIFKWVNDNTPKQFKELLAKRADELGVSESLLSYFTKHKQFDNVAYIIEMAKILDRESVACL